MAGLRKIKSATILLCRATFSIKTRICGLFVLFVRLRRGQIGIERLRLWCRAAPFTQCRDLDHANMIALGECQNVTGRNHAGGFLCSCRVDADRPCLDTGGGKRPRLEKPRLPKPFIQPDRLAPLCAQTPRLTWV